MADITTSVQIVLPQHCNGYAKPRLFGGQLMAWIDIVGAVAARRYTQRAVTTVCVDNLNFLNPAFLNDTVVQEAVVTWTGHTSLEAYVKLVDYGDPEEILLNTALRHMLGLISQNDSESEEESDKTAE